MDFLCVASRDRRVVKNAESHSTVRRRVMTGRTYCTEGIVAGAVHDVVDGVEQSAGSTPGYLKGLRSEMGVPGAELPRSLSVNFTQDGFEILVGVGEEDFVVSCRAVYDFMKIGEEGR